MNNENKTSEHSTIHDFDYHLICEYFSSVERQGPGSVTMTLKALSFIDHLTGRSRIADLGCGTGGQTMTLARHTPGRITGLDLFPKFIERFNEQANEFGVADRVKGLVGSMDELPFEKESLDLIWSEGAIYCVGFERGLGIWRDFLKPGGYVAVTENSWFTVDRPEEIASFWRTAYPEMGTIPEKIATMQRAGYEFIAAFALPESCWLKEFYPPLVEAQRLFLEKHADNPTAAAFVENQRHEKRLYDLYKAHYGYAFYIGQKK
jgi:SAM-dependent methyltransferase